ncbi:MAG: BCCT family transporter [Halioglobus sp.]
MTAKAGWFLILVVNIFIIAALYFGLGNLGASGSGGKDAVPEFSTSAWYAMLLSAGMGIGLMFWSVGEPMRSITPAPRQCSAISTR